MDLFRIEMTPSIGRVSQQNKKIPDDFNRFGIDGLATVFNTGTQGERRSTKHNQCADGALLVLLIKHTFIR